MRIDRLCLGLAVLLAGAVPVQASPLRGSVVTRQQVRGGKTFSFQETFKGGERACVIIIGDHRPVVRLKVKVEDEKRKLIGEDNYGGDFCAVIWYPPRDGTYIIHITVPHIETDDPSQDFNDLYIAVK
jgi:hypothetical protein